MRLNPAQWLWSVAMTMWLFFLWLSCALCCPDLPVWLMCPNTSDIVFAVPGTNYTGLWHSLVHTSVHVVTLWTSIGIFALNHCQDFLSLLLISWEEHGWFPFRSEAVGNTGMSSWYIWWNFPVKLFGIVVLKLFLFLENYFFCRNNPVWPFFK